MIKKIVPALIISIACLLPAAGSLHAAPMTPHEELIYRTNLGRAEDVKLLLSRGASPNEKDDAGVPLISLAASRKDRENMDVLKVIVEAGANLDAKDASGQTALFYAVKQGNMAAVKYLLAKGINYYATDNSNNTARNFAYTSGHKDIGVAIDDFINAQSDERKKQYQEYNREVAALANPPKPTPAPQPTPVPTPTPKPTPEPEATKPPVLTPEEQAAQKAEQEKREKERKKLASDLAFNTCAFQYWSYVSDTRQSAELSGDALDNAIDSYQEKADAIKQQLATDYHMAARAVDKISNIAERKIFNELNGMPSRFERHEEGVGQEDDMQSRCRSVARHWDKAPPSPPPPPPKKKGKK